MAQDSSQIVQYHKSTQLKVHDPANVKPGRLVKLHVGFLLIYLSWSKTAKLAVLKQVNWVSEEMRISLVPCRVKGSS